MHDTRPSIAELTRMYRLRDDRVRAFLAARPDLISILVEARAELEQLFGRSVVVELRIPESFDSDFGGELLAMVQSDLSADAALDRLDHFYDTWWLDASSRPAAVPLYFGAEYAPVETVN